MKTTIITNRRAVRAIEIRTGEHNGNLQIFMQAQWQDETGSVRPSGSPLWIPAYSLDEIIAALVACNNEFKAGGNHA